MRKMYLAAMLLFVVMLSAGLWELMRPSGTVQERKRVAFDETHGEIHRITDTYSAFRDFLTSSGFDIEAVVEGPLTLSKLRMFSVVVILLPTKPFSNIEIEALTRFVEGGGGLLIMGDCGNDLVWGSNVNNISRSFGVVFNADVVKARYEPTEIKTFKPHPITTGIADIVYYSGSSLDVYGNASALAWGENDVWADRYDGMVGVLEPREATGQQVVVMAVSERQLGRVICLGSSTLFLESSLLPDHKKLGLNIFRWLSSVEPLRSHIQNELIKVKFLDDNLHSSFQIDVWDESKGDWTTGYHDVRFYTASAGGFNVTWNMGNTTVKTMSSSDYKFLIVRYPLVKQYGHEVAVIDVGSSDRKHIIGSGWSRLSKFDNRTVRRARAGSDDIHVLINYPQHPWLQYVFKLIYADESRQRIDINIFTPKGWTTLRSFYTEGIGGWRELNVTLDPAEFYVDPKTGMLRFGIHTEGGDLIVDEISFSSIVQSSSIEVIAAIKNGSPWVNFFVRNLDDVQLISTGIIGELAAKYAQGRRFAFSSLLKDAYLEKGHGIKPSQGLAKGELKLGSDSDLLDAPSPTQDFYIYGEGWSESLTIDETTTAREVLANRTNTFLIIPMPSTLNAMYNLTISYLDMGMATVDVNIFNGSQWVGIGRVNRRNTGIWKHITIQLPASQVYFDPLAGGVKLGFFAYESNLVISKIAFAEWIIGGEETAGAFSCNRADLVNFMVVPKAKNRVIQHEVDGFLGVIKTIDILTRDISLYKGEILPVAAAGSVIMDTSDLVEEVEDVPAEGWRPRPVDAAPPLTSGDLAVARLNGSGLSLRTSIPKGGLYRIFVRYYDLPKGHSGKELATYVNGHEIGRITYEGSGFYCFWSTDVDMAEGTNVITLIPLSKVPTSEIAYVDYVVVAPKLWEEQASLELTYAALDLSGD